MINYGFMCYFKINPSSIQQLVHNQYRKQLFIHHLLFYNVGNEIQQIINKVTSDLNFIIFIFDNIFMSNNPIIYGVLFGGLVFYIISITALIRTIKDQNFNKSFLRLIDSNHDEVITHREIQNFQPCEEYDARRIEKAFDEFGRRVDIIDLAAEFTPAGVLKVVGKCFKNTDKLTDPGYLSGLKGKDAAQEMIEGFDLNNDNQISFNEHQIGYMTSKKLNDQTREVFRFFDKNHDWIIARKQLQRSKPNQLGGFLGGSIKRRAPQKKKH